MRIAYDHHIFIEQRHGGISRYFAELVRHLRKHETVEASVIAPAHINEYLLQDGVREHVRGKFLPMRFKGHRRVLKAINAVATPLFWRSQHFDVIHESFYSMHGVGRGRIRITTIYDMIHELFPGELPASKEIAAAKLASIRRADHVICISENTRQDVIRLFNIDPKITSVVYLGCSFEPVDPLTTNRNMAKPYILYVGSRGGRYKNFGVLLQALAESPQLVREVELIAFGGGAFTADENRKIQQYGLATSVRQISGNDAVLAAHYKQATAFVYPSLYEGFGIPPLEAMANDCPVVCSTAAAVAEIVGDAGAYFSPDDSQQLAVVLERVINDTDLASTLRLKGARCVAKYSWDKCATETLAIYRRITASRAI